MKIDEGIMRVKLFSQDLILLSPLFAEIVSKTASEEYLGVIMDVASNLKGMIGTYIRLENAHQKFTNLMI